MYTENFELVRVQYVTFLREAKIEVLLNYLLILAKHYHVVLPVFLCQDELTILRRQLFKLHLNCGDKFLVQLVCNHHTLVITRLLGSLMIP